jgi:hypothetical protein
MTAILPKALTVVNILHQMKTVATIAAGCPPLLQQALGRNEADELAGVLKALADPARLRLLSLIQAQPGGEACVCHLVEPLAGAHVPDSHVAFTPRTGRNPLPVRTKPNKLGIGMRADGPRRPTVGEHEQLGTIRVPIGHGQKVAVRAHRELHDRLRGPGFTLASLERFRKGDIEANGPVVQPAQAGREDSNPIGCKPDGPARGLLDQTHRPS